MQRNTISIIGPEFYEQAVLPFYKALKVYPAPLELIMIYQKTVPEPVFQSVVQIMALEVGGTMSPIIANKGY